MRIDDEEKKQILKIIKKADENAEIYLFGSRLNDNLKGGDIDLLVSSSQISPSDRFDILVQLKDELGDQKIDLVVYNPEIEPTAFVAKILKEALKL